MAELRRGDTEKIAELRRREEQKLELERLRAINVGKIESINNRKSQLRKFQYLSDEIKSESNTPVTSPTSRGGSKNNKKSRTIKVLKKL